METCQEDDRKRDYLAKGNKTIIFEFFKNMEKNTHDDA